MNRPTVTMLGAAAALAALRLSLRAGDATGPLSRRLLLKLGGLGALTLAAEAWKGLLPVLAARATSTDLAPSCILAPEQTEGPYYIAREKVRSNIAEHRPGTPLQLRIAVVDAATCRPIKNAAVDIWHCDAGGVYSGFQSASLGGAPGGGGGPTDSATFMRGIQLTDSHGRVRFETVYPGWYRGRTVHIHVKVHLGGAAGNVLHTGQLYFSDRLTGRVYRSKPYSARAAERDTFNNTDGIYQNGGPQSTLAVKHDGKGGYIGQITLGVRRA